MRILQTGRTAMDRGKSRIRKPPGDSEGTPDRPASDGSSAPPPRQVLSALEIFSEGFAHHINNLMTVVTGYSDLLISKIEKDDPMREELMAIHRAGCRAAGIARQLMYFAGEEPCPTQELDIGEIISDIEERLTLALGGKTDLEIAIEGHLHRVRAARKQLERIVIFLAVNAREAMAEGGKLFISVGNVNGKPGYEEGDSRWVHLRIRDTGYGIEEDVRSCIFLPFFTTKTVKNSRGLGLSSVCGTVRRLGGDIRVDSRHGQGTTFDIYLPAVGEEDNRNTGR
jgi:two-component system cell cycle sensor histidine kinase/response regulator CckA